MNFLAVDTSGKRLGLVAVKGDAVCQTDIPNMNMQHSVRLMGEIEAIMNRAALTPRECDFFACVVGPGSFTGLRIGVATVKGLCLAAEKPALAVTSFEALAYAEESGKTLALVDAGHDFYYACGYRGTTEVIPPAYRSRAEVEEYIAAGYEPVSSEPLAIQTRVVSPVGGLRQAVFAKCNQTAPVSSLTALYLRKSSAEEKR